jgi:glycosyltransferase involved in cell wall biosynthesis
LKTSIIVITHPGYRKYQKRALQSAQSSLSRHREVILHENEGTLAKVCNEAIEKAQGEYIVRLDADDIIDPQLVEYEENYLDTHPEVACVWCDYWKTYPEEGEGFEVHHLEYCPQNELEHACGAMFRKEVWEKLGGYNEKLERQEAFDFWIRFEKAGFKAKHLPYPLYYYRQHPGSMSTDIEKKNRIRSEILNVHNR